MNAKFTRERFGILFYTVDETSQSSSERPTRNLGGNVPHNGLHAWPDTLNIQDKFSGNRSGSFFENLLRRFPSGMQLSQWSITNLESFNATIVTYLPQNPRGKYGRCRTGRFGIPVHMVDWTSRSSSERPTRTLGGNVPHNGLNGWPDTLNIQDKFSRNRSGSLFGNLLRRFPSEVQLSQ